MVIMSVSIVGIYSLVNSGQRLAKTTDDRLIATNLAKEGLESVGALRDTFNLKAYDASDCFFTIDASNLDDTKCYQDNSTTTKYFLKDNKTLATTPIEKPVCINTEWWYSQEFSKAGADCTNTNDTPRCGWTQQKECRTQFTRTVTFSRCGTETLRDCVKVNVEIIWGKQSEQSLALGQTFTRH